MAKKISPTSPDYIDPQHENRVEQNKRAFVKKRSAKIVSALTALVRQHNNALSITPIIVPESQSLRIHFTLGTVKLETRHVATIEADMALRWGHDNGHGKELLMSGSSYVAGSTKMPFGPLNMRNSNGAAHALFNQLLEQELPKRQKGQVVAAWKEAQSRPYRPRVDRTASTRVKTQRREMQPEEFDRDHVNFLYNATRQFGRNIRNRYCSRYPIFEDIDVDYNGETHRMSITFRTARGMNKGNPVVKIEGSVQLFWQRGGGQATRMYFKPESGLNLPRGIEVEPIDISRRSEASQHLFNMVLASGAIKHQEELTIAPEAARHFRNADRKQHSNLSTRRAVGPCQGRRDFVRRDGNKSNVRHRLKYGADSFKL